VADARVAAVQAMHSVLVHGSSFNTVLDEAERGLPDSARSRFRALCFEWARWATQLQAIVDAQLDKPLRNKDVDVYLLMQLGVLELTHMDLPAHTAVNETVKALRGLRKPWAKGLVNAVLRNTVRNPVDVESLSLNERYAYPQWWVKHLRTDWPNDFTALLQAGNQRAPMTLRVNERISNRDDAIKTLNAAAIDSVAHPIAPQAIVLAEPKAVHELPGFSDGVLSVQDGAAQMVVSLLHRAGVKPQRVLDACAAPGGKTAHLLEAFDTEELLALDHSAARLQRIEQTLARLNFQDRARCQVADAGAPDAWWDGKAFDLILLDAPCTGSGVIRRHPDIKHTRRQEDIAALALQQTHLLQALWPSVAPGGYLLYATCSIMALENSVQMDNFLSAHADACHCTLPDMTWARAQSVGYQVFPGDHGLDGFYYALIKKSTHG